MVNSLRKLQRLSGRDQLLLVKAWLLLPATVLLLRILGLRGCQRVLARLAGSPPEPNQRPGAQLESCIAAGRLVRAAARFSPLRAACLPQSLTLLRLLRRKGVVVELRIGVRTEAGRLGAHAWVEYQGCPLNDDMAIAERFHPFVALHDLAGERA